MIKIDYDKTINTTLSYIFNIIEELEIIKNKLNFYKSKLQEEKEEMDYELLEQSDLILKLFYRHNALHNILQFLKKYIIEVEKQSVAELHFTTEYLYSQMTEEQKEKTKKEIEEDYGRTLN